MDSGYHTAETALREAQYQSASFVLGSDHPAAHGRSAGDFLGGFILWGDFRDCIIRPTYIDPQTDAEQIINAAITALSCTGLLVDVAQATPGAPAAVAANAALVFVKLALKKLVVSLPSLGVHFVDLIRVCTQNLHLCPAIGALAKFAKDDDVHKPGLERVFKGLGDQNAVELGEHVVKRAARMQDDFPGWTPAQLQDLMGSMHRTSSLGDADTTFTKMVDLHGKFTLTTQPRSVIVPSALDFVDRPGGDAVITKILNGGPANDDTAFAFSSWSKMTQGGRTLDYVEVPETPVTLARGGDRIAKPDAMVTWPGNARYLGSPQGAVVTEIKNAPLTTNHLDQLERELALAGAGDVTELDVWSSAYKGGVDTVDPRFKENIKIIAAREETVLFVRDADGVHVWNSSLP